MSVTITFTDPTPEEIDNLLGYLFFLQDDAESAEQPSPEVKLEVPVVESEKKPKDKKPVVVKEEVATIVPTTNTPIQQELVEPKAEQPTKPTSKTPSREDIHSLCLELVRKDTGNKEKIKDVLSHFKSKLIKDVPDSEWESFASCITELGE